jgi:hypothetical protein
MNKVLAGWLVGLALAAGCSKRRLAPDGGGSGTFDAGGAEAGPFDVGWPDPPDALPNRVPPIPGQRSFAVTSVLMRDGGIGSAPTSHTFTLVLDDNRRTALAGGAGAATEVPFEATGGVMRTAAPLQFELVAGCGGSSVAYTEIVFTIDAANRLTGTGGGEMHLSGGDVSYTMAASMALTGVLDVQAPSLRLSGGLFTDPLASFALVASEPLRPSATAVLRAPDGETIAFSAGGMIGSYVTLFQKPPLVLRYATRYDIVTDGLADFAGNAAPDPGLYFFTKPLPPLAAEDGFESLTDATFGGVPVLSGAGAPTITGTKSLYIPPTTSMPPSQPEFALRLPVVPTDTVVRFLFRTVRLTATSFTYGNAWALGSVGGQVSLPALPSDVPGMATTATIGGTTVMLGPTTTASFALPDGTSSEVVLQRTLVNPPVCGPPLFGGISGIIIDDLRVE